jgi:hypothetical protein
MIGRAALVLALLVTPLAGASCGPGLCQTDEKAGPGNCYGSTTRYAEDRATEADAGAADARFDARCTYWTVPHHQAIVYEVDLSVPGAARMALVWSGSDGVCTLALSGNVAFEQVGQKEGCANALYPPWIYQPSPNYPPLL